MPETTAQQQEEKTAEYEKIAQTRLPSRRPKRSRRRRRAGMVSSGSGLRASRPLKTNNKRSTRTGCKRCNRK